MTLYHNTCLWYLYCTQYYLLCSLWYCSDTITTVIMKWLYIYCSGEMRRMCLGLLLINAETMLIALVVNLSLLTAVSKGQIFQIRKHLSVPSVRLPQRLFIFVYDTFCNQNELYFESCHLYLKISSFQLFAYKN